MKKILLASALALFGIMNAQVKFGVKGGYSLSNLKVSNFGDFAPESKSTFYVGGLVEGKISDNVRLQGELVYSTLGANIDEKMNYGGYYLNIENKTNLGTLLVPVSVKYYPTKEGLALMGGVNFGFIISAKENNKVSHNLPASDLYGRYLSSINGKKDIGDEFKTFDLAPFIGAEYNFSNGLFIETRYNIGALNVLEIMPDEVMGVRVSKKPKAFNRYWQLGIGYKF